MIPSELLDALVNKSGDHRVQKYVDGVMYFFLSKGISYNEFKELPLPYIFSMLQCANDEANKQKKELDKAKRKR